MAAHAATPTVAVSGPGTGADKGVPPPRDGFAQPQVLHIPVARHQRPKPILARSVGLVLGSAAYSVVRRRDSHCARQKT